MTIDLTKKYRTRDGDEVHLVSKCGKGTWNVLGQRYTRGTWYAASWSSKGVSVTSCHLDLVEVDPCEGWSEGDIIEITHINGRSRLYYYQGNGVVSVSSGKGCPKSFRICTNHKTNNISKTIKEKLNGK